MCVPLSLPSLAVQRTFPTRMNRPFNTTPSNQVSRPLQVPRSMGSDSRQDCLELQSPVSGPETGQKQCPSGLLEYICQHLAGLLGDFTLSPWAHQNLHVPVSLCKQDCTALHRGRLQGWKGTLFPMVTPEVRLQPACFVQHKRQWARVISLSCGLQTSVFPSVEWPGDLPGLLASDSVLWHFSQEKNGEASGGGGCR